MPGKITSEKICLYLPETPQTEEMLMSLRVARTQAYGDDWYFVGAELLGPWDGQGQAKAAVAEQPVTP